MSSSLPFRNLSSSSPTSVTTTVDDVLVSPYNIIGGSDDGSTRRPCPHRRTFIDLNDYDGNGDNNDDHRWICKARAVHPISTDNSFDSSYDTSTEHEVSILPRPDAQMPAVRFLPFSRHEIHPTPCSAFDTLRSSTAVPFSKLLPFPRPSSIASTDSSSSSIPYTTSRRKRKLSNLFETSPSRRMNLRHRPVCNETVQWLAAAEAAAVAASVSVSTELMSCSTRSRSFSLSSSSSSSLSAPSQSQYTPLTPLVEELWLGPVFEDSETILSAIRILPSTVKFLDLDLRNALHLLPQALPLLLRKTHITTLSVRFFGDAGAIELAKWVHLNPNLERLNLQGNRIGSLGARTLVDAIIASGHHRRSLRHLNLSCNCILHGDLIGQLLALSTSLESVDVQFNWLGDQDVVDICQGLRKNKSVRELSLYGCQRITKAGVTTIMKCLEEHNTSLHDVKVQALDDESDTLVQRISYWTDLNKAGRYLIQSSPDTLSKTKSMMTSQFSASSTGRQIDSTDSTIPSGLWPLALEKSKDQPNALYYLLRHGSPKILNSS